MKILILYKFELQIKMWKDQQAENENGQLDQSAQQEIYLSKLDNISSYLKSINQRLYQTVCAGKKPHSKTHLLSTITNFDKCIEDYNNYYFRKRLSRLLYFKIDPLAIQREQKFFDYKLYHKEKNVQERVYFIKFVYSKGDNQFYRMHVEIWKHDGHNVITNQILSRFQKNLTNDLIEGLKEKGFISHFQENSVTLKCKRPNHKNPLKSTHEQLNLMDCIQSIGETFLKQMIPVLSKEHICPYCGKHLIYQSRLGLMVPPTIIISTFKQTGTGTREQNREQKYKILHETCSLKYMKPNVPAIELRGNNEIRQQNQVQGQVQTQ